MKPRTRLGGIKGSLQSPGQRERQRAPAVLGGREVGLGPQPGTHRGAGPGSVLPQRGYKAIPIWEALWRRFSATPRLHLGRGSPLPCQGLFPSRTLDPLNASRPLAVSSWTNEWQSCSLKLASVSDLGNSPCGPHSVSWHILEEPSAGCPQQCVALPQRPHHLRGPL